MRQPEAYEMKRPILHAIGEAARGDSNMAQKTVPFNCSLAKSKCWP